MGTVVNAVTTDAPNHATSTIQCGTCTIDYDQTVSGDTNNWTTVVTITGCIPSCYYTYTDYDVHGYADNGGSWHGGARAGLSTLLNASTPWLLGSSAPRDHLHPFPYLTPITKSSIIEEVNVWALGATMIRLIVFGFIAGTVVLIGNRSITSARAEQQPHEYAEIKPMKATLEDFRLKTVLGDRDIALKEFVKGRRLVLISFIAPWCDNSVYDAPLVAKLYEKYADKGLEVLTVSNYAPAEELLKYVERFNFTHPVVLDTLSKDDTNRLNSRHYQFRKSLNDSRKWGTPLNVFIVDGRLDNLYVAAGELIEANAIQFIETHLESVKSAKPAGH